MLVVVKVAIGAQESFLEALIDAHRDAGIGNIVFPGVPDSDCRWTTYAVRVGSGQRGRFINFLQNYAVENGFASSLIL